MQIDRQITIHHPMSFLLTKKYTVESFKERIENIKETYSPSQKMYMLIQKIRIRKIRHTKIKRMENVNDTRGHFTNYVHLCYLLEKVED